MWAACSSLVWMCRDCSRHENRQRVASLSGWLAQTGACTSPRLTLARKTTALTSGTITESEATWKWSKSSSHSRARRAHPHRSLHRTRALLSRLDASAEAARQVTPTLAEVYAVINRPLTAEERRVLVEAPLPALSVIHACVRGTGGISVGEPVLGKYGFKVGIKAVALRGSGDGRH